MTKQQIIEKSNSGHSMLFSLAAEVCDTLTDEDVRFTCEQAEDSSYDIEAQTED